MRSRVQIALGSLPHPVFHVCMVYMYTCLHVILACLLTHESITSVCGGAGLKLMLGIIFSTLFIEAESFNQTHIFPIQLVLLNSLLWRPLIYVYLGWNYKQGFKPKEHLHSFQGSWSSHLLASALASELFSQPKKQ